MNIPWEQFRLWLNKTPDIAEVEVPVTRRSVKLLLIRHGESEMNTSPELICGRSNSSELTNRGWEEALVLGARLKKLGIQPDEIYSSPAVRTIQTANITLEQMDLTEKPVERPELLEISMGEWTGQERKIIYTPRQLAEIEEKKSDFRPPGGESQRDVERRMAKFVDELVTNGGKENATILVFTHGIAIRCLLRWVLDAGPVAVLHTSLANTSITELEYKASARGDFAGWHLKRMNDSAHLE